VGFWLLELQLAAEKDNKGKTNIKTIKKIFLHLFIMPIYLLEGGGE
jgi:hypothetical protein